jgi:hypothetical protein
VELRRRRYARGEGGGAETPVDDLVDLASSGVWLAVREMCCRIATDSASFLRAAANLARVGQLHLSDEKLRQVVQAEGRAVLAWQPRSSWIAGLIDRDLPPEKTTAVLDFYHASQHVHQARRIVFGESSEAGSHWADDLLHLLAGGSFEQWWQKLVETRGTWRSPPKRAAVDDLMRYLVQRREKVD